MSTIRSSLIIFCSVVGICLAWFLPIMLLAFHDAWGMSIATEFDEYELIDEQKLAIVQQEKGTNGYSIEGRIRNSETYGIYTTILSFLMTLPFVLIIFLLVTRNSSPGIVSS